MRRTATGIALWIAAAFAAVFVAFQGVNVVGDQVTDERPAALAASEVEQRLAAASSTTSTSRPDPTTVPPSPETVPPTTAPPSSSAAPTTPPGETRTYELTGGTAVLRFSPAGVEVVFATPNPDFSVEQEPEHGNGVKVEFESETHESRVEGWWDGGPRDRVDEGDD